MLLPDENAAEIVERLRGLLKQFETVPAEAGVRPDPEALAVLSAMLKRLEELERRLRNAPSEDEKEAVKAQFSSLTGLLTTTTCKGRVAIC